MTTELPTYIINANQENYNQEFNQTLREYLSNKGFQPPYALTTAEIIAIEPEVEVGTQWFNTSLAKLQVKTAPGVIETITSV